MAYFHKVMLWIAIHAGLSRLKNVADSVGSPAESFSPLLLLLLPLSFQWLWLLLSLLSLSLSLSLLLLLLLLLQLSSSFKHLKDV